MCSIFGLALFRDHKVTDFEALNKVISRLAVASLPGGRAASGVSIMQEKAMTVLRAPMPSSRLVETESFISTLTKHVTAESGNSFLSLIGHCRLPTKGHESNNKNNHPIVIKNVSGVHNGVIRNDDELFLEYEGIIERIAEVDTEIIFQLIEVFVNDQFDRRRNFATVPAIKRTAALLKGSFACAVHNARNPYNLYIFRSGNSVKIQVYKESGILIFATREHYIEEAVRGSEDLVGGWRQEIELLPEYGVAFNLYDKTMYKFSLGSHKVSRRHTYA